MLKRERRRADEEDRVDRRLVARVQAREPRRQQAVPPGHHRQPRVAGEHHARLRDADARAAPGSPSAPRSRCATPSGAKPMLSTCGIGAIRSIWSIGTSASTELVPRMNITAMIGAAITTDHAIAPHRVAALAGVNRHVLEAAERAESHLAEQVEAHDRDDRHRRRQRMECRRACPCATFSHGSSSSAANVASISTPPALCTHLPMFEPDES